jgi:hypothetical protein
MESLRRPAPFRGEQPVKLANCAGQGPISASSATRRVPFSLNPGPSGD